MQTMNILASRIVGLTLAFALMLMTVNAWAQNANTRVRLGQGGTQDLVVPLFKSNVVELDREAARISVGSPDIADILILRATQLYVLGKDIGTTNVLLWDRQDVLIGTLSVEVTHDLESLKGKLYDILPDESIAVYSTQRNIVLTGTASSITAMNAAVRLADGYLQQISTAVEDQAFDVEEGRSTREDRAVGEVINLLKVGGGQTVMLEVKVAEISREELRGWDTAFQATWSGSSRWNPLGADKSFVPAFLGGPALSDTALFGSFTSNDFLFDLALVASKEKGLARILAEPTLTTLTGTEANFLSGGSFPIPVPQSLDKVTIEYKEFGIQLTFLPVVLGSGHINLSLDVDISEITGETQFGPTLSNRTASSTVELKDGQTMGIAGLISEETRETVRKFPGLGDIPVLGALFRSQQFQNGESELVIMVTPHLAKPIAPQDISLPTDKYVEPNDWDFYLMGRLEGKSPRNSAPPATADDEGGVEGEYGQQIN
jgi:pilus assembly protein CpaC